MRGIVLYIYEDICKEMMLLVIKAVLNNDIVRMITNIEQNKFTLNNIKLPAITRNKLRKNSKKKSSYASNKIEGNPLTEKQVSDVIDKDEHKHFLKPEQEVRNYYMALNYLEEQIAKKAPFTKELILKVQSIVEKGASKEKIGLRGAMPPGYLFAVYDSETQEAEYIPPEYNEIPELLDELVEYVNTTDDHPLIIAAIVHYQIITIHAFEDGNGRTARLLSGYILDYYGYGFQGIGSLEEYFAYDSDEYYSSLQMGLPALYYMGRENPPHPEIWITYFLRMMELYSNKVCELSMETNKQSEQVNLSYLNKKDKELLAYLIDSSSSHEVINIIGASLLCLILSQMSNPSPSGSFTSSRYIS
jgi:Fic family protein